MKFIIKENLLFLVEVETHHFEINFVNFIFEKFGILSFLGNHWRKCCDYLN